jgi:hypothetical protein
VAFVLSPFFVGCGGDDAAAPGLETVAPETGGTTDTGGAGGTVTQADASAGGGAGGSDASSQGGAGKDASGAAGKDAESDAGFSTHLYPLKTSANKRTLVTQDGAPFLLAGDAPQCLTAKMSVAEMAQFFSKRAQQTFNAMWVNLLCNGYTGGKDDATTSDGIAPFTGKLGGGKYDLSTPNPVFFARVDAAVKAAADAGIVIFLDPIETGGFLTTLQANGVAAAKAYGRFLGQRYVNDDNIVWFHGNDFQSWRNAPDDALVQAVALGIKELDARHLHTIELDYNVSSSLDDAANWSSTQYPILGLNCTYTYYPTYAQLYKDYSRASFLPNVMIEANYEGENNVGGANTHPTNAHDVRTQYYWSNLSGATGSFYGNKYVWPIDPAWASHMDDPGGVQMKFVQALFLARAWYDLVPDQTHVVVTAGLGTYADTGNAQNNDYATAARTADGTLVMTYMPTARTITVDMTKLAGSATARFYDPTTGAYTAVPGSPLPATGTKTFTPPAAKHADGFDDWVLVLETSPP